MADARRLAELSMPTELAKEVAKQIDAAAGGGFTPTPGAAIPNLAVSGDYATDSAAIQSAVNGILATLRANSLLSS